MRRLSFALFGLFATVAAFAADPAPPAGQKVFSAGHSFHMFVPGMLAELAKSAGIEGHQQVGTSSIGGSYTHQHWNVPEEKNKAKTLLTEGKVDVLTLAPIYLPDDGIGNFVKLAAKHNPKARVTVQEFWLPYDVFEPDYKKGKKMEKPDRNARTSEQMRKSMGEYAKTMDDHVRELNKEVGRDVVFVVPAGQAQVLLREKIIAKEAPGLETQEDLFTDAIGHAKPPLQVLNAYCHFAVIYKKSPVGLPVPAALKSAKESEKLNALLQELAWQAVTEHPLSGVRGK